MSKSFMIMLTAALVCGMASGGWGQGTNQLNPGGNYSISAPSGTNYMLQVSMTNAGNPQGDDNLVWSHNGRYMATDRSDPSVGGQKFINLIGIGKTGNITNLGARTSASNNPGPVYPNVTDFTVNDDRVLFGYQPTDPPPANKLRLMSCSVTGPVNVAIFLKDPATTNYSVSSPSVIFDPMIRKERLIFLMSGPGNPGNVYTVTYEPGSVPVWTNQVALTSFTSNQNIQSVKWCPEWGTNFQPLMNRYTITRTMPSGPPPPPPRRGLYVFTGVRDILNASAPTPNNLNDPRFDARITNASGGSQGTWTFDGRFLMCGINTNDPSSSNEFAGLFSIPSAGTNRTPIPFPTPPEIASYNKQWLCISPNGMRAAFTVNKQIFVLPLQFENNAQTNAGTTNIITDGSYTRVVIPGQAIDSNYTFTIVEPTTVDTNQFPSEYAGNARELSASGVSSQINFLTNVEMSLHFEDADVPEGVSETNLAIFLYNPQTNSQGQTGTWTQVQSTVDTNTSYVTSSNIQHFSIYALGERVNEASTLSAPTGVSASDGAYTDKVAVTWTAVTGATSYVIYRSLTNTTGSAAQIGTSISAAYDDTAAANWPGLSLFYWVKAMNSVTNSDYSVSDQGYCAATMSGNADLAASSFLFLPASIATNAHPDYAAFVVRNNGPDALADAAVSYYFYISRNATFDTNTAIQIGGFNDTLRLSADEAATITLTETDRVYLTIPSDATGSYYVFVRVRAATVSDLDLSNNIASRNGTISIDTGSGSPRVPLSGDFDGDGKTDLTLYQESSGAWSVKLSASGYDVATATLGGSGYSPIARDFDGDGKADVGVYYEITGSWAIMLSASGYDTATLNGFGGVGYVPAVGDYDGDGKADPAVYYDGTGLWLVKLSSQSYATAVLESFGGIGYASTALDFDGDGKADPAVYQGSTGNWMVKLSGSSYATADVTGFGGTGYQQVSDEFDGDHRADAAVYQTATGNWRVMLSASSYATASLDGFGGTDTTPVVGDFDGDGKADPALYQESSSTWLVKLSASDYATAQAQQ